MNKKRVLFLTEATYLSTGYATYSKQVMQRLHDSGKYKIAELSVYGSEKDERRKTIPWKNYPNLPNPEDAEQTKLYSSDPTCQFGAWRFERACLDFKPDVVLSIRDFWMDSFIMKSPFRRIFNWCWMPTVDASPQNEEWIHYFSQADSIVTYSDWASNVILSQSGGCINFVGTASPSASEEFVPMDKESLRKKLNIEPDVKIIGTVMRNQRRKLFPVLFEAFAKYIHNGCHDNTYLYCHTSYPDAGWDLGQLLHTYGISSRVLFTYVCSGCKSVEICKFNDARKVCDSCGKYESRPVGAGNGVSDADLAQIYNLFDLYVQCANSEGFGLPQVEAAACGIPIACTNYSAMEDVIKKLDAYPIQLDGKYKELETGCDRAVPNVNSIVDIFYKFFNATEDFRKMRSKTTRYKFEKHYSWDKTSEVWMNAIDNAPYANWSQPPIIKAIVDPPYSVPTNRQFITECVNYFMIDPTILHSHDIRSLQRDLNFGTYKSTPDGFFYSEFSPFGKSHAKPLGREDVGKMFTEKLKANNYWESARAGLVQLRNESWLH